MDRIQDSDDHCRRLVNPGALLKIKPDAELDLAKIGELMERVAVTVHDLPDGVRLQMNGFLIYM